MLFINQFFWPDSSATSQQLTDLVSALVQRQIDVAVLCGEGGYAASAGRTAPLAEVHRVRALPFTRGRLGRICSYLSFYVSAFFKGIRIPKADVVISMTTPPLISLLGACIKLLRGSRHFIWEQDLYPEIAVDLQYLKAGGMTHRITGLLADLVRRHADGIIVLGPCMRDRLIARGVDPQKIHIAEHWASSIAITPLKRPGNAKELVVLYSGNLGLAHDLETIEGALLNLRSDTRFRFLFAGTGGRRKDLADFCEKHSIQNVEFRPFVDRDKLSEGLAAGDIGLVTQREESCGAVVPSKAYGILAAGRPLLFIGPSTATPALLIDRYDCGWHIRCGDVQGATNLLLYLAAHPELVREAGTRAREALVRFHDLPQSVNRIADILGASQPPSSSSATLNFQTTY
ncbi:MAG: glycosyltransferase family 4 protein [Janthinobacterium lividum]